MEWSKPMGTCLLGRRTSGLCLGFRLIGLELQVLCFLFCRRCLGFLGLGDVFVLRHATGHGVAGHGAHHTADGSRAQGGTQARPGSRWRSGGGSRRCGCGGRSNRFGRRDGCGCWCPLEAGRCGPCAASQALGVSHSRNHQRGDGQGNHGSCRGTNGGVCAHGDVPNCEKPNGPLRVRPYRKASKTSEKEENS